MTVAKFFSEAKKLPFDDRIELAHCLWDEFMDGFQGYKAPPIPKGVFVWKTLKSKIDAELSRGDRIKLAERVWRNVTENGYDPQPTPEQIIELERRAEEALKHPGRGIPLEQIRDEMKKRYGRK